MEEGSNINELAQNLQSMAKRHVKVQTAWAVVKSINWGEKTMVATGVLDELDYHDVLLGIGGEARKPKLRSQCLLGMIENQDGAAFLIAAEEYEGFLFESQNENLGKILDDLIREILNIYAPKNVANIGVIRERLKKVLDNGTQ